MEDGTGPRVLPAALPRGLPCLPTCLLSQLSASGRQTKYLECDDVVLSQTLPSCHSEGVSE